MRVLKLLIILFLTLYSQSLSANQHLSLSGKWGFKLDAQDKGIAEKWYNQEFKDDLVLPGSLLTNNIGDNVTVDTKWTARVWNEEWYKSPAYAKYRNNNNLKMVYWLTPNKYYVGKAWYQKKVIIPAEWNGQSIRLYMERCHWYSDVWIDGNKCGMKQSSLSVPHIYDFGKIATGKHIITICIDNNVTDINPGLDAHSITDNTQGNWNGIIGKIELEAFNSATITSTKIIPNFEAEKVATLINVNNPSARKEKGKLEIEILTYNDSNLILSANKDVNLVPGNQTINVEYALNNDLRLWDEFNPQLYKMRVRLKSKTGTTDYVETFGLRKLGKRDTQITINDRPVFFRGTLECCIFPKAGFPPTDEAEWIHLMSVCKNYGLNHIRFHSWCPPEAAFRAADRLGIYLYVESCTWSHNIGSGETIDKYVYDECKRIIDTYGNHPSLCLISSGNEPHGENHKTYVRNFVKYWKAHDSRFLYTTTAGWPAVPESDWLSTQPPRIQGWGQGLKSIINSKRPNSIFDWNSKISKTQPTISHEIGQWCVYPDLKERCKYTGVYKAKNFDIFEDRLKDSGLENLADSFLLASGKLQLLCYKADIEAALRTKDFAGFQLLDLHDFPGQGSALVGILNPFWEEKGYVSAEEYREFCNQVVPLARMSRFVFNSGDSLKADIEIAQFSKSNITDCVKWNIVNSENAIIKEGKFDCKNIPTGTLNKIGKISEVITCNKPQSLKLNVSVGKYKNHWNLWVYPKTEIETGKVLVANKFDDTIKHYLEKGGKVLLTPAKGTLKNEGTDSVEVGFSSIFWNTMWTNKQAPHTLGLLCNKNHEALKDFPTNYHSDYQWWDAMSNCNAIPLNKLNNIKPIVRIIDDWFTARSLGLIVEMKVGNGSMILCGADLLTNYKQRPEAQQLLSSLLNYMNGTNFKPKDKIKTEQIISLFKN